jgi:hypothetical protein
MRRVSFRSGERVAAGVAQHVNVNRKGEASGARTDALNHPVDGIGRERTSTLQPTRGSIGSRRLFTARCKPCALRRSPQSPCTLVGIACHDFGSGESEDCVTT